MGTLKTFSLMPRLIFFLQQTCLFACESALERLTGAAAFLRVCLRRPLLRAEFFPVPCRSISAHFLEKLIKIQYILIAYGV